MALNTGKLVGKTAFITGASRGIGKAIALKLARDGANVTIAAKTAEAHPKLPGTIYTAAKEVEDAGGKCLPCIVDVRDEKAVHDAVEHTVKQFGGIDILVNNASAIRLSGTLATPMKSYDLMNGINARGTYLCTQACLPYLKKSQNPHVLNISPPLNMHSFWFKGHVAYTMAKYGMSMCVLGMAEEFKEDGIAVNALWPRTAIATAAMEMLGGADVLGECRKPEIMSDAAYVMLCSNSRSRTGQFAIDEDILKEVGVTNFDEYAHEPGRDLLPDFFLDLEVWQQRGNLKQGLAQQHKRGASGSSAGGQIPQLMAKINSLGNEEFVKSVQGIFAFELTGDEAGQWYLDLKNGTGSAGPGLPSEEAANVTMTLDSSDFVKMFKGEMKPTQAFMSGKLKIKGDMMMAIKLEKLMKLMTSKL